MVANFEHPKEQQIMLYNSMVTRRTVRIFAVAAVAMTLLGLVTFSVGRSGTAFAHTNSMDQRQQTTGAMPMTGTMPMGDANPMMGMMQNMMQMMTMMKGTMPMSGAMPMSGTSMAGDMPMKAADMGQMMGMMSEMMDMMSDMQGTMNDKMPGVLARGGIG